MLRNENSPSPSQWHHGGFLSDSTAFTEPTINGSNLLKWIIFVTIIQSYFVGQWQRMSSCIQEYPDQKSIWLILEGHDKPPFLSFRYKNWLYSIPILMIIFLCWTHSSVHFSLVTLFDYSYWQHCEFSYIYGFACLNPGLSFELHFSDWGRAKWQCTQPATWRKCCS